MPSSRSLANDAPPGVRSADARAPAGRLRLGWNQRASGPRQLLGAWRWAAVPLAVLYLVLLAARFRGVIATSNLDADTVSAPVIGELFAGAAPHANVILGTFGWYASLLFELATKWLPAHRQVWEVAPYVLALAGFALTCWSVWRIAGRWAAAITAVLLLCTSPDTLHLLLSMTQHGPDWFCAALLGAFLVLLESPRSRVGPRTLAALALSVGVLVGINAASDVLVTIAGIGPFVLSVLVCQVISRTPRAKRVTLTALGMLVALGVSWLVTDLVMNSWKVGPEPGLSTTKIAALGEIGKNFRLWWQSIATLGNGDYFGKAASLRSVVAVASAVVAIAGVALLPALGWRALKRRAEADPASRSPERLAFVVFWCCSAILLSAAFLLSGLPLDRHADRYLVGVVYAAAAVIPVAVAGRVRSEAAVAAGTFIFALAAVTSMAEGAYTSNPNHFPSTSLARRVEAVASAHHLHFGYGAYWDAAAITWASHFRTQIYPVSICDQSAHLCRFDLHVITSWYSPRPRIHSFLLVDPSQRLIPGPTPDLGRPLAVYHVGRLLMYVYPYDLAQRIRIT